jgi:hypothetical protein
MILADFCVKLVRFTKHVFIFWNSIMPLLPEELYGPKRRIESDDWYGYEFYIRTPIARWTLSQAEVLGSSDARKPFAIDFGGSSGFQAMRLARKGFDVNVIDLQDERKTIEDRNNILFAENEANENEANGKISLAIADVRKIDAPALENLCKGRQPSIVMAYNLIHFLNDSEMKQFVEVISQTASSGSVFALSYDFLAKETPIFEHVPEDVTRLAQEKGFDVEHTKLKGSYAERGFRLNYRL